MNCPKCGWPMRLIRTKKALTSFIASFTCMNQRCQHERVDAAHPRRERRG
jgi:hypothetical protein